MTTEAEEAAHTAAGSEAGAEEDPVEEEQDGVEGLEAGEEEAEQAAVAPAGPLRSGSHSSWADEADAEEAEEARQAQQAAAGAAGAAASPKPMLLPPPPPPPPRQPRQQPMVPPAQLLLQALRSSSAASAAAAAAAAPADSGSPLQHIPRPPGFRPRALSAMPSPQLQPRVQPAVLVGATGGEAGQGAICSCQEGGVMWRGGRRCSKARRRARAWSGPARSELTSSRAYMLTSLAGVASTLATCRRGPVGDPPFCVPPHRPALCGPRWV